MRIANEIVCSVANRFMIDGTPIFSEECKNGHINSTYFVTCDTGKRYVIQKINTSIFKDYEGLMKNIVAVTKHLRSKYKMAGYSDFERRTLNVIPTKEGAYFYKGSEGDVWRAVDFITDADNFSLCDSVDIFRKVGAAFGRFQQDLEDFDASVLFETIKNFHNTRSRFEDLMRAIEEDKCDRRSDILNEIAFVEEREELCSVIVKAISEGKIPLRVTHNDTKLNNIMVDKKTGEGICVIDLDTVMPGSLLYDFGDSIRFGASSAIEDERDLEKVYIREEMFEAYAKGFICATQKSLTDEEADLLPLSAIIITLETGIRFLTDFLNGDTYFRTEYPTHNLDRARNQFKLVMDMEGKYGEMVKIIAKIRE